MISCFGALPSAPLVLHCTAPLLLHSSARSTPASPPPFFFHTSASFRAPYAHTQAGSCSRTRTAIHSLTPRRAHTYIYSTHGQSCSSWQLFKKRKKLKPYICFHKSADGNDYTTQIERYDIESSPDNLEHGFSELTVITNLRVHACAISACTSTLGLCASIDNSSLCSCFVFLKCVDSAHWLCASPAPNLCLCVGLSRSCFLI